MNGSGKDNKTTGGHPSGRSSVDLDELSAILELLSSNEVTEFELKKGDMQLSLKRGKDFGQPAVANPSPQIIQFPYPNYQAGGYPAPSGPAQQPISAAVINAPQSADASISAVTTTSTAKTVVELSPSKQLKEITSPIVGTFYRRPAVDAEPYIDVGDTVKKGDVLCIVEAMKLMNEIEADFGGKVIEICVQDTSMVEYGEVLFRIEPV